MLDNFDAFFPVGHFMLLVPKLAAEVSTGGLIIPEQARASLTQGTVAKKGALVQNFDLGDELIFAQHTESRVEIDGRTYYLVEDLNIVLFKPAGPSSRPFTPGNPYIDTMKLVGETSLPLSHVKEVYLAHESDYNKALAALQDYLKSCQ